MNYGYIRAAAAVPFIKPADCVHNAEQIIELIEKATEKGCHLLVFPRMCVTGATCGSLAFQGVLLEEAEHALYLIAEKLRGSETAAVMSLPMRVRGGNEVAEQIAVLYDGSVYIVGGRGELFAHRNFIFAAGTELFFNQITSATVAAVLSAEPETAGGAARRREAIRAQSSAAVCGYIYAGAGAGESTTDSVFSGHCLIAENGRILSERPPFDNESRIIYSDIDIELLSYKRAKAPLINSENAEIVHLIPNASGGLSKLPAESKQLFREIPSTPFVPRDPAALSVRCEEILQMQSAGLEQRLRHIGCRSLVLGLSGGMDSTLALLAALRAFKRLELPVQGIFSVTMPCFGTTGRTLNNAKQLGRLTGISFEEISIKESVLQHFRDINHSPEKHDLTYENAQARERTQVLMDIASQRGCFVLGTGDLSELALGWATFNGDHMSMYNVNCGVPKTLIPYLIRHEADNCADNCADNELRGILYDITQTPVSPELLPPLQNGKISQITEENVGPYVLHDFFLYHMISNGFSPEKILFLAERAFADEYSREIILKWLKVFYKRFFANQFKRSSAPDGPSIGSVSLSPRAGVGGCWQMPSDAAVRIWIDRLE